MTLDYQLLHSGQQRRPVSFSLVRPFCVFPDGRQPVQVLTLSFTLGCAVCPFISVMSLPLDTSCSVLCHQCLAVAKQRLLMALWRQAS